MRQKRARTTASGRSRSHRGTRASSPRVVLAALATAGVVGVCGVAVASAVHYQAPQHAAATPVTPRSGAVATTTPPPVGSAAGRAVAHAPSSAPTPSSVASSTAAHTAAPPRPTAHAEDGPLRAQATVNADSTIYWAQNDLTVRSEQPLASLSVEVRIALNGDVLDTGHWQTLPAADFTVGVTRTDAFLVYRWTLKPGLTVPAGQYVFACQYNHATGNRDAGKDTFRVETGLSGRTASVWGKYPGN